MACCGHRRKAVDVKAEQKWDYINLQDFRSKGCGTPTAYVYLWFSLLLSIAVYAVDTFTAVNLLVFDRWSSAIKPAIDVNISKYIFSACIIASIVNLAFEWVRAARIMKRGNIAECYLDNLAVRWESIRMGSAKGFRRFLVFAELTKSKRGAEYIALFTYFSFQSWIRVLLCTGPRQVVNAFTLKAVYQSDLLTVEHDVQSSLSTFFLKLKALAASDYQQTLILCGMVFTVVVWVFSALFLLAAVLFYVLFLFHWIPRDDGGLTGYCERKINKALLKIVTEKVNKALEKGWKAEAAGAGKKNGGKNGSADNFPSVGRAATLPTIPDLAFADPDKLVEMPSLTRTETVATLPVYTSRPTSPGGGDYEMNPMDRKRPLARTATMDTMTSTYNSRSSLVSSAANMGYSNPAMSSFEPPYRTGTSDSMRSMATARQNVNMNGQGQGQGPNMAYAREYSDSSADVDARYMPSVGSPAPSSTASAFNRPPTSASQFSAFSSPGLRPFANDGGRASPAPPMYSNHGGPDMRRPPVTNPGHPPIRSATNPVRAGPALYAPQPMRNMTSSVPPRLAEEAQAMGDYFSPPVPERSLTGPVGPHSSENDYWNQPQRNDYRSSPQNARGMASSATSGPREDGSYYSQSQSPHLSPDRHTPGQARYDFGLERQR